MNLLLAEMLSNLIPEDYVFEKRRPDNYPCTSMSFTYFCHGGSLKCTVRLYSTSSAIFDIRFYEEITTSEGKCSMCASREPSLGPAILKFYENGEKWQEFYYRNGRQHRPISDGPAISTWSRDGEIIYEQFWENGVLL